MDKTTYIVTGFMRCGTSMMMQCLIEGGLDPAYDEAREQMNETYGDKYYKPNEGGFYELSKKDFMHPFFPRQFEGKLIKVLWGGLRNLCVGKYKIVFMMRHPEEIRQSFEAFFNLSKDQEYGFLHTLNNFEEVAQESIARLENRKDVELSILRYREVVAGPWTTFAMLQEAGWPIDAGKAAAIVDPTQCRFKREELTLGI